MRRVAGKASFWLGILMVLALIPTWGASSLLSPLVLALAGTALWVERRMWQAWVGLACGVLGVAGIFEFVAVNF